MADNQRKVMHVVASMNRGGVETWLMRVLRQIDRDRFQFHFLVHTVEEAAYDSEIRALGGTIHACPAPRNWVNYRRQFKAILEQHGPFDIVHSHLYLYSGFVLKIAAEAGVPVRIAHVHTDPRYSRMNVPHWLYRRFMRKMVSRFSTHRVGISKACAARLQKGTEKAVEVIYCGIDFSPFKNQPNPASARLRLGIPQSTAVIGHVGRFTGVKNHSFLVQAFSRLLAKGIDAHLLLVGDGPLRDTIEDQVRALGLTERVTFAGLQPDVLPFLQAMDLFVFPSLYEGLPVSVLEAQAAGVPSVVSAGLTEDMDVIPELIERVPLSSGAAVWADAMERRLEESVDRANTAERMGRSNFTLRASIEALTRIYSGSEITADVTHERRAILT